MWQGRQRRGQADPAGTEADAPRGTAAPRPQLIAPQQHGSSMIPSPAFSEKLGIQVFTSITWQLIIFWLEKSFSRAFVKQTQQA